MATFEVCLAARDFGPGRAQEGDVIDIRPLADGIGLKEGADFLWLAMDESELAAYRGSLRGSISKYRFNIPLADIKSRHGSLDLAKVRDRRQWYQPFLNSNPASGERGSTTISTGLVATDREV